MSLLPSQAFADWICGVLSLCGLELPLFGQSRQRRKGDTVLFRCTHYPLTVIQDGSSNRHRDILLRTIILSGVNRNFDSIFLKQEEKKEDNNNESGMGYIFLYIIKF